MKRYITACLAVFLTLSVASCGSAGDDGASGATFDNTGGAPPPGASIGFAPVSYVQDMCTRQLAATRFAVLARSGADIPVIGGNDTCSASLRTTLADAFAALSADQALGIFTLSLGGCVRTYEVAQASRDGLVVRPWILLHDTTLGAAGPVACTTDLILSLNVLRFDGATGTNAMELQLGKVNSNYPRNPAVPVF